jgi:hypothetical protein
MIQCMDCKYCRVDESICHCRRHAPQPIVDKDITKRQNTAAIWPIVFPYDCCGEAKYKEEEGTPMKVIRKTIKYSRINECVNFWAWLFWYCSFPVSIDYEVYYQFLKYGYENKDYRHWVSMVRLCGWEIERECMRQETTTTTIK